MTDFTGLSIEGRDRHPGRRRLGRGARSPGTWRPTSDPSAVAFVESAEDVAATVALRGRERPPGRRPGHRPRRRPARRRSRTRS